jgi:ACS family tartrate transporter-like MFS transporter
VSGNNASKSHKSDLEITTIRRVAFVLIPFLMICYFVSFIDRVNVGFAAFQMNKDLGLTASVFGFGGGLFFLTYFLFEVPSNLAMQRFGARRWLARIMISWGIIATCTAFVVGPWSFYAFRLLLGVGEAGFFPGVLLYLSYWFPAEYRARMVSLFYVAVPLAGFLGSPVSAALLDMEGIGGLHGWQWLFIVEGLMPVLLGILTLIALPDRPKDARFLSDEQRLWLSTRLLEEQRRLVRSVHETRVWAVLFNPPVLFLALVYAGTSAASNGLSIWQPQIIKSFGLTNMQAGLLNSVPFGLASVAMILWAQYSDRRGKRVWFTVLPLALSVVALVGCVLSHSLWPVVLFLSLTLIGTVSFKAPFWALATETLSPEAAAAGLAMINAVGNLGGFLGTYLIGVLRDATGSFLFALSPILIMEAIGCVVVVAIGQHQKRLAETAKAAAATPA